MTATSNWCSGIRVDAGLASTARTAIERPVRRRARRKRLRRRQPPRRVNRGTRPPHTGKSRLRPKSPRQPRRRARRRTGGGDSRQRENRRTGRRTVAANEPACDYLGRAAVACRAAPSPSIPQARRSPSRWWSDAERSWIARAAFRGSRPAIPKRWMRWSRASRKCCFTPRRWGRRRWWSGRRAALAKRTKSPSSRISSPCGSC